MFPYRPGCSVRAAGVDRLEGDAVLGRLGVVGHRVVVEPVAPEDLGGQVAGPHLDGAAGVGCRPLQGDDQLGLTTGQVPGREDSGVLQSRSDIQIFLVPALWCHKDTKVPLAVSLWHSRGCLCAWPPLVCIIV